MKIVEVEHFKVQLYVNLIVCLFFFLVTNTVAEFVFNPSISKNILFYEI